MKRMELLAVSLVLAVGTSTAQYNVKWTLPGASTSLYRGAGNTDADAALELLFLTSSGYTTLRLIDGETGNTDLEIDTVQTNVFLVDADGDGKDEVLVDHYDGSSYVATLYDWGGGGSLSDARAAGYRSISLGQNRPNPTSANTRIHYSLAKGARATLRVYNSVGQMTRTLVDADMPPGSYDIVWDRKDNKGLLSSAGTYFYELVVDGEKQSRQMMTVK